MKPIQVFISYSFLDDALDNVKKFHAELEKTLRRTLGYTPRVFLAGRTLQTGDIWTEEISHELAACHVFVPLLSPNYFTSEPCLKEWWCFEERIKPFYGKRGIVVPIAWSPSKYIDLPSDVDRRLPINGWNPPTDYLNKGMHRLIQQGGRCYQPILDKIAKAVLKQKPFDPVVPTTFDDAGLRFQKRKKPDKIRVLLSHHADDNDENQISEFAGILETYLSLAGWRSHVELMDSTNDPDNSPGREWTYLESDSLQTCDVFIAMYSSVYFSCSHASKAWWFFTQRVQSSGKGNRTRKGVVPLTLYPLELVSRPSEVGRYQVANQDNQRHYKEVGLMRLQAERHEEAGGVAHADAMWIIVDSIREAVKPYAVPSADHITPYAECEHLFTPTTGKSHASSAFPVLLLRLAADSSQVNSTAAPNAHGARTIPAGCYGGNKDDWSPYVPSTTKTLIEAAQETIFQRRGYTVPVFDIDTPLPNVPHIQHIPVLLVDSWLTGFADNKDHLKRHQKTTSGGTVLIPKNAADRQACLIVGNNGFEQEIRNLTAADPRFPETLVMFRIELDDAIDGPPMGGPPSFSGPRTSGPTPSRPPASQT